MSEIRLTDAGDIIVEYDEPITRWFYTPDEAREVAAALVRFASKAEALRKLPENVIRFPHPGRRSDA